MRGIKALLALTGIWVLFGTINSSAASLDDLSSFFHNQSFQSFEIFIRRGQHESASQFWHSYEKDLSLPSSTIPWPQLEKLSQQRTINLLDEVDFSNSTGTAVNRELLWDIFYFLSLFEEGKNSLNRFIHHFFNNQLHFEVIRLPGSLWGGYKDDRIMFAPTRITIKTLLLMVAHEGTHAGDLLGTDRGLLMKSLSNREPNSDINSNSILKQYYDTSAEHRAYRCSATLAKEFIYAGITDNIPPALEKDASMDEYSFREKMTTFYGISNSILNVYFDRHEWDESMDVLWKDEPPSSLPSLWGDSFAQAH